MADSRVGCTVIVTTDVLRGFYELLEEVMSYWKYGGYNLGSYYTIFSYPVCRKWQITGLGVQLLLLLGFTPPLVGLLVVVVVVCGCKFVSHYKIFSDPVCRKWQIPNFGNF